MFRSWRVGPGGCELMSLHVFAYGSLMWRPDFPYTERTLATVRGRHRRLCVFSWVHRGTPERPGLVLGLDRGGTCRGVLYTVRAADADAVVAYLREREQVTAVYLERHVTAVRPDGKAASALTYVVDRTHRQYTGRLTLDETLQAVRGAVGRSGRNEDYVIATADHLAELGIRDPHLSAVAAALRA